MPISYRLVAGTFDPYSVATITTVHVPFVTSSMQRLINDGVIASGDSFVAVAAGANEASLFSSLGITDATITNLADNGAAGVAPFAWSHEAAQDLSFADGSFDWGFVVDGLHHCPSPHAGLLELYRVARKGVIVFEASDSALMRFARRTGMTGDYEIEAVVANNGNGGGVNNTPVPNFVYRWTEAEFEKTIRSNDPTGEPTFRYFRALHLPREAAQMRQRGAKRRVLQIAGPVLKAATKVAKKQRNSIGMIALKPSVLHPWLHQTSEGVTFNPDYQIEHFK